MVEHVYRIKLTVWQKRVIWSFGVFFLLVLNFWNVPYTYLLPWYTALIYLAALLIPLCVFEDDA